MSRLEYHSILPVDPHLCYQWHMNPGAFHWLIPPWEDVRVISKSSYMTPHSLVKLKMKKMGVYLNWVAEHLEFREGKYFTDRQLSGPFKKWNHRHVFGHLDENHTLYSDIIDYQVPLEYLVPGFIKNNLAKDLRYSFAFRHKMVSHAMEVYKTTQMKPEQCILIVNADSELGSLLTSFLKTLGHKVFSLVERKPQHSYEIYYDPVLSILDHEELSGMNSMVYLPRNPHEFTQGVIDSESYSKEQRSLKMLQDTIKELESPPEFLLQISSDECTNHGITNDPSDHFKHFAQSLEQFGRDLCAKRKIMRIPQMVDYTTFMKPHARIRENSAETLDWISIYDVVALSALTLLSEVSIPEYPKASDRLKINQKKLYCVPSNDEENGNKLEHIHYPALKDLQDLFTH